MSVSALSNAGRVTSAIQMAASRTGVDFNYLLGQAKIESGLNADARSGSSSAAGLYQFIGQSWLAVVKKHGAEHGLGWAADAIQRGANGKLAVGDAGTKQAILNLRNDPAIASLMAAEHAADNKAALEGSLGRTANGTDLYMAHFLGLGGARQFLAAMQANPGRAAAGVFPAAAAANRGIFFAKDGSARSLADIYDRFAAKLGNASSTAGETAGANLASRALLMGDNTVVTGGGEDASDALAWATSTLERMQGAAKSTATAVNVLRPTPDTARLAYMMLAGMGR